MKALDHAARTGGKVVVSFDGIKSAGSSFFEEAFGGLISKRGFTKPHLKKLLEIKASSPSLNRYVRAVERYIDRAKPSG